MSREEEVWSCLPALFSVDVLKPEKGKLHVTVKEISERRKSSSVLPHLWQGPLIEGSYYRIDDNTYVASPELIFVQMAQSLTFAQLIALGDELCGLYSFDERCEQGIRQREVPLTSCKKLEAFLSLLRASATVAGKTAKEANPHSKRACYGITKGERALKHVIDCSGSPRETAIEMFLALPCYYGGYGFRKPIMNHEITLSPEAANIAKRETVRADLFWKDRSIDLEYNGKDSHTGETAIDSDRSRTIALEIDGFEVVEISRSQFNSWQSFESIALLVANKIGKKIAKKKLGPLPQRLKLRSEVFAWNKASGRSW